MSSRAMILPPMAACRGISKILAGNQFAQFVDQDPGFGLTALSRIGDEGKGIHLVFLDQDIHLDQIAGFVADKLIVHAGIAAADAFELVVVAGDHLRQRKFIGQHGAPFIRMLHVDESGAFFIGKLHDRADVLVGHDDR